MAAAVNPIVLGIRLVVGLAVVIALIYLTGLALRSLQQRRMGVRGRPAMELRESLPLGPGKGLHLVRIGKRLLVLGATGTQISVVAEVDAGSLEDAGRKDRASQADSNERRRFNEILEAYRRRFEGARPRGEDTDDEGIDL
ncbi:MAG: FliO/MopB family protein [Betaproteobacteria bacterium]